MFGKNQTTDTQKIGFLLIPEFSMIAFTSAIEPLRAANRISGKTLFEWFTISTDGEAVKASNEVTITPDLALDEKLDVGILFVCAGLKVTNYLDPFISGRLRTLARENVSLGSVCTGTVFLAEAGLLNGVKCTIHWENIEGFVEAYPKTQVTATLFEIDKNIYTCSGGTAPLDMMIYEIKRHYGESLSLNVADQMLYNYIREPHDQQRMAIEHRMGIHHPNLLASIGYMEAYIETQMSLHELASTVNISLRQLERLFQSHLQTTPARYYLELRLRRARQLLKQTAMSVLQVAVTTGFTSASHFTQSYKKYFGYPPRNERA